MEKSIGWGLLSESHGVRPVHPFTASEGCLPSSYLQWICPLNCPDLKFPFVISAWYSWFPVATASSNVDELVSVVARQDIELEDSGFVS
ncbi:MAG: hypothetical protein NTV68_05400 [Methanomicrobiales archaeon]|nr:hypothetical protein [Methanomicrobiales archaeon]